VHNFAIAAQDTSVSTITKSQDMIDKEEALRQKLEKDEKIYLKKVIVTGVTLVKKEEIREILQPFKNHWISKNDIQMIMDSITLAYKNKGYHDKLTEISYKVNKSTLHIIVLEKI
jgi:hemolysin activation/secretion protein